MTREEAIEVYHGLLNPKIKEAFEVFAPELKESEDERIRKKIIRIIQVGGYMSPEEKDKAFVWLEKQKEQKPLEYLPKEKVYSIMSKLTSLSYSNLIPINSEAYRKIDEITSDVLDLLKSY